MGSDLRTLDLKGAKEEGFSFSYGDGVSVSISQRVYNSRIRKNQIVDLGEYKIKLSASTFNLGKKKEDKDPSKDVWFVFVEVPDSLLNSLRNLRIELGEITPSDLKKLGVNTPYEIDLYSWLKL
ncbi:hypothetical protein KKG08_02180 [Patescibacteria group bacterium]|nr:hypothetical protein [Patescibacteria group bacterium]